MRLDSFQIINCFGFRDSGIVTLVDAHNFIYILGRNSSGKSSLLNAIKYFEPGVVPQDMPNFRNFNDTGKVPWLRGDFSLVGGELKLTELANAQLGALRALRIDQAALNHNSSLNEMIDNVTTIYNDLVNSINETQQVKVHKDRAGHYHFTQDAVPEAYDARVAKVSQLINQAGTGKGTFNIRGNNTQIDLSWHTFEDQLIHQFPNIYLFNEKYSLRESLPERIVSDWLNNGAFERSFVEYLGAETVNRFLASNDPDEREELLALLNTKVVALTEKVNQHPHGSRNKDLLEIKLHEKNGIQITIKTDGKKSYYSHLSDNTKFLFAYHLYAATNDITGNILLFDEPTNGFHPTAQEFVLNFLKGLAAEGNLVIVATHSEHLIDLDLLSGVRLMGVDSQKNITVKNHFYNRPTDPGDYLALQPILDAIGFRYGNQINIRDKVSLTEGITDLLYIRSFNSILEFTESIDIAPGRGDGTLVNIIPLFISQNISFKIVLDKGDVRQKIQSAFGIDDRFVFEVPVPDAYQENMERSGIEDLFTKNDFEKLLSKFGYAVAEDFPHVSNSHYAKTSGHKRIIAHQFYETASTFDEEYFEEETVRNFRMLLDFCTNGDWFAL